MVYFDCRDWTESKYLENDVLTRLNNMGDQYNEFQTYFNAHDHDDLYYTKSEADAKYYNFSAKGGDYDLLDGMHGDAIRGLGVLLGGIYIWGGSFETIPEGYELCDGMNDTPNLINKQLVGAGNVYEVGDEGGNETIEPTALITLNSHTLTIDEIPSHYHTYIENHTTIGTLSPFGFGSGSSETSQGVITATEYTEYVGGGNAHNHTTTMEEISYEKSGSYIKLPFIKKVS